MFVPRRTCRVRKLPSKSTASGITPSISAENRPNPTTVTLSGGPPQSHETKWPILYRIVAIPLVGASIALPSLCRFSISR